MDPARDVQARLGRLPPPGYEAPEDSLHPDWETTPDHFPEHRVWMPRGVFLGKHEVTWRQFEAFCAATGARPPARELPTTPPVVPHRKTPGAPRVGDDHPVFGVTWHEAREYATWLGGRLPTEAEWEYAARGPRARRNPWGDDDPDGRRFNGPDLAFRRVWWTDGPEVPWDDQFAATAPVGSFPAGASPFGCLDLLGNVSEWTATVFHEFDPQDVVDPKGPEKGPSRVIRGGSWYRLSDVIDRSRGTPDHRDVDLGFRVAIPARP